MQIKLDKFEGPLDLLIKLIEDEELDITEVSLAQVADQYIKYLEETDSMKPEELADFLVVASRLLYLKSKVLLPQLNLGEEGDDQLEQQLKIYKKYYDASQLIEQILGRNNYAYSRPDQIKAINYKFMPSPRLTSEVLKRMFAVIIGNLRPVTDVPKQSLAKVILIKDRIEEIKQLLAKNKSVKFHDMLTNVNGRMEMIVSFLGLLELVKQRSIVIQQGDMFGEIVVSLNH